MRQVARDQSTILSGLRDGLVGPVVHKQCRFGEARSEIACAIDTFEKLGAGNDAERCRENLQVTEGAMNVSELPASHE